MVVSSRPYSIGVPVCNALRPGTDVELAAGQFWQMAGDRRWQALVCLRGEIWVTQERDFRDYVLAAGEVFIVTQRGAVVVEALEDAVFEVTPSLQAAPYVGRFADAVFS